MKQETREYSCKLRPVSPKISDTEYFRTPFKAPSLRITGALAITLFLAKGSRLAFQWLWL